MTLGDKIEQGLMLNEKEIWEVLWESDEVSEECEEVGHRGRWNEEVYYVFKLRGKLYRINYSRGLTESQENYYPDQVAVRVVKQKRVIEIVEYVLE
jgi:hypothetical protein